MVGNDSYVTRRFCEPWYIGRSCWPLCLYIQTGLCRLCCAKSNIIMVNFAQQEQKTDKQPGVRLVSVEVIRGEQSKHVLCHLAGLPAFKSRVIPINKYNNNNNG